MRNQTGGASGLVTLSFKCEGRGQDHSEDLSEQRFEVFVIHTNARGTLAALAMADRLAKKLQACLRLVMPYEVPYPLALDEPAVPVKFLAGQLRTLASHTSLEVAGDIYLCRDKRHTLRLLLRSDSLVIVGGRKRWWPTAEQKLARALEKGGRQVIFVELR